MGGKRKHTHKRKRTTSKQTKMDPSCDTCGDFGCTQCQGSDGDNDYNLAQYNSDDDE